jgi:hypothetical protein
MEGVNLIYAISCAHECQKGSLIAWNPLRKFLFGIEVLGGGPPPTMQREHVRRTDLFGELIWPFIADLRPLPAGTRGLVAGMSRKELTASTSKHAADLHPA